MRGSTYILIFALGLASTLGGKPERSDEALPWHKIKQQKCNVGMQSAYRKPFFRSQELTVTCGIYNDDTDMDFSGKPCCCSFCGQRDPYEQLCEISKHVCTTAADCIQRKHGECVEEKTGGGIESFHVFWVLVVGGITMAPFIVPVVALAAAEDIVLGLAG